MAARRHPSPLTPGILRIPKASPGVSVPSPPPSRRAKQHPAVLAAHGAHPRTKYVEFRDLRENLVKRFVEVTPDSNRSNWNGLI